WAAGIANSVRPTIGPSVTPSPTDTIRPTNINPNFPPGWNSTGSGGQGGDGTTTDKGKSKDRVTGKDRGSNPSLRAGFLLPPSGERRFVPDEVILSIGGDVSTQALDVLARRHGMTRLETQSFALTGRTMHRWRLSRGSVASMIRALSGERLVAGAQPNYLYGLQQQAEMEPASLGVPGQGDPTQYAVGKLHLVDAHRLATGDQVLIAVIDSGIDDAHPDLAGAIVAKLDTLGTDEKPHIHGTEMAGAIVAHDRLLGVAPRARLLAVRAFGASAGGEESTTFRILRGLDWAAAQNARIVNMSFAGPPDPALADALGKARKKGIVLIAAAGNAGPKSPPLYPAADPNVIAVTATDADDKVFAQANRGNYIAVAAPGVDVLVPAPDANVALTTGTSVAAAHVSGLAALLIQVKPSLKPDDVRKILATSAKSLGPKMRGEAGAGLADALAAVTAVEPKGAVNPGAEKAAGQ
ncbi:MAG TPA: S8 family serine peptidase, partial [Xanthobacteraceae bacterium]|nr:S8 family serine peptidase [Xanthobacteraceae bacterium]